jgi:hypothetical protein
MICRGGEVVASQLETLRAHRFASHHRAEGRAFSPRRPCRHYRVSVRGEYANAACRKRIRSQARRRTNPTDDWQFRATVYGNLPTLSGSMPFPTSAGSSITVDPSKIIGALKFGVLGALEVQKSRWGRIHRPHAH